MTTKPYNPFAADTNTVFGWVALDNIRALEARISAVLFEVDKPNKPGRVDIAYRRRYTKVCAYEYSGFRPEVWTGQTAEKLELSADDERAALTVVDTYGVWSIDSRLRDQAEARDFGEALRRGMYVKIEGNTFIEMQLRTPEGRRAWWVVKTEDG